jgi:hypothetical protein
MAPLPGKTNGATTKSWVAVCFFVILGLSAEGKGFSVDFLKTALVSAHSTGVKVICFDTDP